MRAVNLLPREEVRRSFAAHRGVVFTGVGGAALTTALLASMLVSAGGTLSAKQSELDSIRAQIAATPPAPVRDTSARDAIAADKGARVAALSGALSGRIAWDRVLRQVSLVLPEDVWLTNLAAVAPGTDSAQGGAAGVTLTGATYSQNGVARFLSRLAVVPDLENVRLRSSQSEIRNERELVQFTIFADLTPPGSGEPAAPPVSAEPATEATS